jgi:hypothetical protein
MEAQREVEVYVHSFSNLSARGLWVVNSKPPPPLTHGKDSRYPFYRKLGRQEVLSEQMRKISSSPGFDPRMIQPVACRYVRLYRVAEKSLLTLDI